MPIERQVGSPRRLALAREHVLDTLFEPRQGDPRLDALLTVGSLTLDLRARHAYAGDRRLLLTAIEFDLLAFLAARPGRAFTRQELAIAIGHSTLTVGDESAVAAQIRGLRTKIESDPRRPVILTTVRGTGYQLEHTPRAAGSGHVVAAEAGTVVLVGGEIVDADRVAGEILGVADEHELVGRDLSELAAGSALQATRERMVSTPAGDERRSQLIDLERGDGSDVSVEVASTAGEWNGRPASVVTFSVVPDLSEKLRHLVTGVLSDVTDAVIITDLHFHLHSWNSAAERLYGWSEAQVLGRHVLDVIQWVDDDGALGEIWAGLEANGRWKGKSTQVTRDGSLISVLATTTLVRDDSDEPFLIVSVNRAAPAVHDPQDRRADDDDIRRGIANDEFEVYYQPVVALADRRIVNMEALVRWNHPQRGLLGPGVIIATAELHGSIIDLGHVVLQKSCDQAARWRDAGFDIDVSVNLSARQLSDPDLFERVTSVLDTSGLDAHRLLLEVTETSLVDEVDQAIAVVERLADLGVGFAIDDFGTGWASLTYLRSFPIHELKIDRTFVAGVGRNANDTAIARSILSLGAELGLVVIAEGIETLAQQKALQRLGCTMGQGYLYGRPTTAHSAPVEFAGRIPSQ